MTNELSIWLSIAVIALVTAALRFLPFWVFPEGRKRPRIITYLGTVLPYAIMGMLVVYCLKGIQPLTAYISTGDTLFRCKGRHGIRAGQVHRHQLPAAGIGAFDGGFFLINRNTRPVADTFILTCKGIIHCCFA